MKVIKGTGVITVSALKVSGAITANMVSLREDRHKEDNFTN